jgi:ArsR family metal-binding transcriptional regulator
MLLTGYQKRIFRAECNPSFESVHCKATLDEDIGCALPYLNAVLGGTQYLNDPPEVMFHVHGRIIKVGAREIAINALKDEAEADKILGWLQREINDAWDKRATIAPCTTGRRRPQLMDVLKRLPRTNCRQCGLATCMVFAARVVEGAKGPENCPAIDPEQCRQLEDYLAGFVLDG